MPSGYVDVAIPSSRVVYLYTDILLDLTHTAYMEFFKKLFGGGSGTDNGTQPSSEENFTCGSCGKELPVSQKKQSTEGEGEHAKNTCEFC